MRKLAFPKKLPKSLGDLKFKTALPLFFMVLLIADVILFMIHLIGPELPEMVGRFLDLFIYMLLFLVLFVPLIRDHQNLQKADQELQEIRSGLEVRVRERTAELMASYEQIRLQLTAMESAAEGIVITDRNGVVLWCNAAMTSITGYLTDELVGQSLSILKSGKQLT